jgi:hypothetical protein
LVRVAESDRFREGRRMMDCLTDDDWKLIAEELEAIGQPPSTSDRADIEIALNFVGLRSRVDRNLPAPARRSFVKSS